MDQRSDMADRRGSCNDRCGCPVPCPGGAACRCEGGRQQERAEGGHNTCSCGEHCGCNPCNNCPGGVESAVGVGKAHCKCGSACNCTSCAS